MPPRARTTAIPLQIAALLLALLAVQPSQSPAAVFTYFGGPDQTKANLSLSHAAREDFLVTLSSYGVEDLEDLTGQINPTLTFTGTSVTATTGFSNGVNSEVNFSVSGTNFLFDTEGVNDWMQFSQPVTAFGMYLTQSGDGPSSSTPPNQLKFRLENTLLGTTKDVTIANLGPNWPFWNVVFVGVTDTDPFNKLSIIESFDHDGTLPDDLTAGFVVPLTRGDFDRDGVVNNSDLSTMLRAMANLNGYQAAFHLTDSDLKTIADINGDGVVTNADIQAQLDLLAAGTGSVSAVPEPSTAMLVTVAFFSAMIFLRGKNSRQ